MKKIFLAGVLPVFAIVAAFLGVNSNEQQVNKNVVIDTLASALTVPWDICFLPGGEMLFTERPGRVRVYKNNQLQDKPALTIDSIEAKGKMGLLGLCIHPAFNNNHLLYVAYNYRKDSATFLRVVRYRYENNEMADAKTIIENIPGAFNHTGCRLIFGPDKKLYITTGDADVPKLAQDLKAFNGKILRLNDDGTIPNDNPFVKNDTALHQIWTYGHRNSQGLAFQPGTNVLFNSEHGPTGGDEVNIVTKGNNYGWPVVHHRDKNDAMMSPLLEFSPSIGPAEALFYSGKAFPLLKGHLLIACMRGEAILNIQINQQKITAYDFLLKNTYKRIRALTEGPDGYLYFSTAQVDPPESKMQAGEEGYDMILRMRPAAAAENKAFAVNFSATRTDAINSNNAAVATPAGKPKQSAVLYAQLCAGCHGEKMEGKDKIPALVDPQKPLRLTKTLIANTVNKGVVAKGMPAWEGVLTNAEINQMADYILQQHKSVR